MVTESSFKDCGLYRISHCSHQGHRPSMEDRHYHGTFEDVTAAFVFDGHGGQDIADRLATTFPALIPKMIVSSPDEVVSLWRETNDSFRKEIGDGPMAGSTCTGVIRVGNEWRVYNCGDSATYIIDSSSRQVVFKTKDHSPSDPDEMKRIYEAGASVLNGRINGNLAVARSFGDWYIPGVICDPDITIVTEGDVAAVMCDGIYESFRGSVPDHVVISDVIDGVLEEAASRLIDNGLTRGSGDNLSAIVVSLNGVITYPTPDISS